MASNNNNNNNNYHLPEEEHLAWLQYLAQAGIQDMDPNTPAPVADAGVPEIPEPGIPEAPVEDVEIPSLLNQEPNPPEEEAEGEDYEEALFARFGEYHPHAILNQIQASGAAFGYPPRSPTPLPPTYNDRGSILPRQTAVHPAPGPHITANHTETADEDYWPNIANWISNGEGPKPVVDCKICYEHKLHIPNLQEPSADNSNSDDDDDGEGYEDAYVLGCGHVLRVDCLESWVRSSLREIPNALGPMQPLCPICRRPVYPDELELEVAQLELMLLDGGENMAVDQQGMMEGGDEEMEGLQFEEGDDRLGD